MMGLSQFSSVVHLCPTLCNPMDCSTPGFPVHHQLLELAQTHVHQVGDAIQPSHPLSSPSPPAFNLSQHQGLFQGVYLGQPKGASLVAHGKESACSAGDLGLIPGSGRSPGEGNGYPLQYSCLERGAVSRPMWFTSGN